MQAEIAARAMPLLKSALGNRTGYAVAFAEGLGITEALPRSAAADELRALVSEIQGLGQ